MRTAPLSCLIVAVVLGVGGCRSTAEEAERSEEAARSLPAVEIVQAREGAVPLRERLTGTVRAAGEVAIYPEASGPVVEVLAQNGDAVKKGDPLVRIQTPRTRAQLTQARSGLAAARAELEQAEARYRELAAEYDRTQALGERGLVPLNTVDSLREQTDAARAAVTSARAQVQVAEGAVAEQAEVQAQTLVRAPISGRIGQRNVEVGMRVDTQTALFVIGRLENMRVEVPVTQDVVTRIREGQRVELGVGSRAADRLEARVSRISPFLQPGSFSAEVEIDVPNETGALVPGMFVTVDIFYGESERTTLVPTSALYDNPATGEQGVFVVDALPEAAAAGQGADVTRSSPVAARFRPIDIVAEAPQAAGVKGVKPGEWIVVVGQHLLAGDPEPTTRVRVMEWERVMELQQLQRQDVLQQFMERQQRARTES